MSIEYLVDYQFENVTFYFYKYEILKEDTNNSNLIRVWDNSKNDWSIPLLGPPMEPKADRRRPASYGYKDGYVVLIKHNDQNTFMSINDFFNYSTDKNFMEILIRLFTENDFFDYFEFQLPCYTNDNTSYNYLMDRDNIMYFYFVGLSGKDETIMLNKCNEEYKNDGLWKIFETYINSNEVQRFTDETNGYIYRINTHRGGNNLLFLTHIMKIET
jgi:hypothetical protein